MSQEAGAENPRVGRPGDQRRHAHDSDPDILKQRMNRFTPRIQRWLFDLKIKWNSLGVWSRLTKKNRVMSYLLRRSQIKSWRLGQLKIAWVPLRRRVALPEAPLRAGNKCFVITRKLDIAERHYVKVIFDKRATGDALDEICKQLTNERP